MTPSRGSRRTGTRPRSHESRQPEREPDPQSRSNFYYAFLSLPRARRDALYAVYAFCRTVDDAADLGDDRARPARGDRPVADGCRAVLRAGAGPAHPIALQLRDAVRAYPIPRAALEAIIDGCEMDLDRVRYERAEDLYPYCYRVASAVGLCCIEIFGYTDPRARDYAVQLGTALQLTNIIRDVGTDARVGRVYLPQQDLKEFGVTEDDLVAGRYDERFLRLMEHQAARAREFYAAANRAFPGSTRARWCRPRSWGASTGRCWKRSPPSASASSTRASRSRRGARSPSPCAAGPPPASSSTDWRR